MSARDYRDIIGGVALLLVGISAGTHALTSLNLGTITQMGPGMLPAVLGFILAAFGIAILVPALFRNGEALNFDARSFVAISTSIFAFAVMVRPFGLVPATVVLTLVASRADGKLPYSQLGILAAGLSLGAILFFKIALGMQFAAFNWPW